MNDFKPLDYNCLVKALKSVDVPEGWDEELTETAGFVPLEVRMRQMEQNGYIAQFKSSDFTSDDMRDIWMNPDFEILPGDELEEVERKTLLRQAFQREILSKKNPANAGKSASAGVDKHEADAEDSSKSSIQSKETKTENLSEARE